MKIEPARVWRYNQKRRKYLGKLGKLVGFTTVRTPPEGLEKRVPYVVGLVKIGQERLMAQIVDIEPEEVRVGMKVVGRLRRLFDVPNDQLVIYGVKFVPIRGKYE